MTNQDVAEIDEPVRIAGRQFARELTYEEIEAVAGAGCGGTDTVMKGETQPQPDKSLDCDW